MKTRNHHSVGLLGLVSFGLVIALAAIWQTLQANAGEKPPLVVDVTPGKSKATNVGCGFGDLSDDVYELRITLTPNSIIDAGIDDQAGVLWDWERDEMGEVIDIKKFHAAGVDPNKRFWVVIWAKLKSGGQGDATYWMSVSDVDADADTDNNSTDNPRTPSESNDEDYAEYPGYQAPPVMRGIVIGVNDDHDEFLPNGDPWGRDFTNTTADLNKEGTNYNTQSVGLAQIKMKVGVKRAPGDLKFSVPSTIRLFEGELPEAGNKGAAFLGNRRIDSVGEKTYVFYMEGVAPDNNINYVEFKYDPDGAGTGEAVDTLAFLPVQMDIDVDSDNSGGATPIDADNTHAEDRDEAKPGTLGMIVPVVDDPNDSGSGKPGILRGLYSQNVTYLLTDPQRPAVITLKKVSGAGDVRVWKVRQGQDPVLMLDTSVGDGSTTTDGDGHSLFELLGDASDHNILITGKTPGEVLLGLQLTVNGAKVAMDVVRVFGGIDLDIDSDNDNGFDPPGRTLAEDQIEDKNGDANYPGKVIAVNDNDDDNDGIPDFADGFNKFGGTSNQTPGEHFVPLVLELPEPIDLTKAKLRITYDASDPDGVTRTGSGTEADPYIYAPAAGHLRIWTKDGGVARNRNSVKAGTPGDYVPPDTYDDVSKLGLSGSTRIVTFFVEGIAASAAVADQRIKVELDPDGSGPLGFLCEDAVRVTMLRVNLLVDTNRDGTVDAQKDLKGKADWTKTRGAIFSVNCDRDGSRDDGNPINPTPFPDAIHFDDSGNPVNEDFSIENDDDILDIAPMVIRKIGVVPSGFKVFLKTTDLEDVQRTHIYKKIAAGGGNVAFWGGATATATSGADASGPPTAAAETRTEIDITRWVDPANPNFQGDGTTGDATFGLEGLMFRFVGAHAPAALRFDGVVDFTLELRKDATVIASSAVRLKVAPWIMLSRDQASEEEWAVDAGPSNATFLADLGVDAGGQLHTEGDARKAGTQWFQDHIEIGYTQRPGGPKSHVVFRLPYYRGPLPPNPTWPLFDLLKKDKGAFQLGVDRGGRSGDFGGNLEVLPPNAAYPLGRIAMGNIASDPLKEFLSSQEVQSPVFDVPTAWLAVGHIDEVTSFLAGGDVAVADPTLAWSLISDTARIPAADRHKAVFFATGAAPEGGTVGGATSTRLYDGPATGSITVVKVATKATGSITTVAKANLVDGETFTIGDGRSTKTFEFDVAGNGVGAGNVVVDVSPAGVVTADDVRNVMIAAINGAANFAIRAEAGGAATLTLTTALPGTVGNVAVTDTVANAGFAPTGMAGGADDGILDGETVTVSDGTTAKTFEFDTFGGVTAGNVQVDLSAASTADEVRDALIAVVNGVGSYTVESVADGSAKVHLWNETKGTVGNQAITETVADAGFTVTGMSGGKAGGRDFTAGTWNYVRTFTYTAGKPDKGQVAHIATGGCHDGWIEIDKVWDTTSKLVPGGGATAHIFGYTQWPPPYGGGLGEAPARGTWHTPLNGTGANPDKYVVVEDTKFWTTGTPAIVSVEEVLADADFEALNRTDAQGQIDAVKASLDAARTGLLYKSVPCLFFGDRTGFAAGRSAVAFNPGPTNLQTVNGHLYVPKQFCPLHQTTGVDIYATAISDALGAANVRWVDDWEYYHALEGEVHCGTAVKHTVLGLDWWSYQP